MHSIDKVRSGAFERITIESWTQEADYETAQRLILIPALWQIAGNCSLPTTGIAGAMSKPRVYGHFSKMLNLTDRTWKTYGCG